MNKYSFPRILPFAIFMAFIAVEGAVRFLTEKGILEFDEQSMLFLYLPKAILVGLILFFLRSKYSEISLRDLSKFSDTALSVLTGVLVFVLWVNMDWAFATLGNPQGFNPTLMEEGIARSSLIGARLAGAAIVVPIMEEIFWRSFLIRYIIDPEFQKVSIGKFTWLSFLLTTILFGLEHHLFLAGIMAGVAYNLLLYRTRSLSQCILAHAVTNLMLGIYVLNTQKWLFW